jgi:sugar phosphate isomerase/epimerase
MRRQQQLDAVAKLLSDECGFMLDIAHIVA